MNSIFEKLVRRSGLFSSHFLIHLYDEDKTYDMYFVNNTEDITYEGTTYKAGAFSYSPSASEHGFNPSGKLEIAVKGNNVIDLIESNTDIYLDVVACILEDGTVSPMINYSHHYGKVTGNRQRASFEFEKDDRLEMTFPSLIWSSQNNRGNS